MSRRSVRIRVAGVALLALCAALARGDEFDTACARLRKAVQAGDHDAQKEALEAVPGSDSRCAKALLALVPRADWLLRGSIVTTLTQDRHAPALIEAVQRELVGR